MSGKSKWSLAVYAFIALAVAVSTAEAQRHGGRHMGGGPAMAGICGSATTINNSLAVIELMVKPTPEQQSALNEAKNAAKLYGDIMLAACAGAYPTTLPERMAASEKRLDVALSGIRNLKPTIEKFYAALTDEQKSSASSLLILPGV
jgi:LTXXQ motif family protein